MLNYNNETMKRVIKSIAILFVLCTFGYQAPALTFVGHSLKIACTEDVLGGAYVTLADKFGGEIGTKELKTVRVLGIAGCAQGSKVYAFVLEIKSKGKTKRFIGDSNSLSKEILNNLGVLNKGDTFIFTKIKANLPTGGKIDALGRTFTVV
jgi:hypothetical protein